MKQFTESELLSATKGWERLNYKQKRVVEMLSEGYGLTDKEIAAQLRKEFETEGANILAEKPDESLKIEYGSITAYRRDKDKHLSSIAGKLGLETIDMVVLWYFKFGGDIIKNLETKLSKIKLSESNYIIQINSNYIKYKNKHTEIEEDQRKINYELTMKMRELGEIYNYLMYRYERQNLLKLREFTYPVVFKSINQKIPLDRPEFLFFEGEFQNRNSIFDFEYRFNASAAVKSFSYPNKFTFCLDKIVNENGIISIHCYIGDYFSGIDTCVSLEWELLKAFKENPNASFSDIDQRLKLRNTIEENSNYDIFSGNNRFATIGVACLMIYRDKDSRYKFVLGTRSNTGGVGVYPDSVHVAPAGMFQTDFRRSALYRDIYLNEEFNIQKTILKEFLEEIFDLKEYKNSQASFEEIYEDEIFKCIKPMFDNDTAEIIISGIAMDLFNLRPEICCVMIFHEYNEVFDHIKPNDEYEQGKEGIHYFFLDDFRNGKIKDEAFFAPKRMVLSGAAALWKGLEVAEGYLRNPK